MKGFTIAALLGAVGPALAQLPAGAHDPRPAMPKPNVCDNLCDSLFQFFFAKPCTVADCVDHARAMTCGQNIVCSISCGYTHVGCVDSSIFNADGISRKAKAEEHQVKARAVETGTDHVVMASDPCDGKYASTVTVTLGKPKHEQASKPTVTKYEPMWTKESDKPAVTKTEVHDVTETEVHDFTETGVPDVTVKASSFDAPSVDVVRAIRKRQDAAVAAPATSASTETINSLTKVITVNAVNAVGLDGPKLGEAHLGPPASGTMTMTGTTWVETMGSALVTYTHIASTVTFGFSGTTTLPSSDMAGPMPMQVETSETSQNPMLMPTLPSSYNTIVITTDTTSEDMYMPTLPSSWNTKTAPSDLAPWDFPKSTSTTRIYTTKTSTVSVTRVASTTTATASASQTVTTTVTGDAVELLTPAMAMLALLSAIIIVFL